MSVLGAGNSSLCGFYQVKLNGRWLDLQPQRVLSFFLVKDISTGDDDQPIAAPNLHETERVDNIERAIVVFQVAAEIAESQFDVKFIGQDAA